ncbi:MAG: hypothetical protein IJ300_14085 [Clostridia bacterium]|nr:hypothetical protein [Clostridia bacterium]
MKEDKREFVKYCFWGLMALILVGGFVLGIVCANSLKEPTYKALEAMEYLEEHPYTPKSQAEWKDAKEGYWSTASTIALLTIWLISLIGAFFVYIKKLGLEMTDTICHTVQNIENKLNSLAVYRIVEKKADKPSQPETQKDNT